MKRFVLAAVLVAGLGTSASAQPPLPPLPARLPFHVSIDGVAAGPFDMGVLADHVRSGKLTRSSLVWKSGMANWVTAETVPELQPLFATVPPPLFPPPTGPIPSPGPPPPTYSGPPGPAIPYQKSGGLIVGTTGYYPYDTGAWLLGGTDGLTRQSGPFTMVGPAGSDESPSAPGGWRLFKHGSLFHH